jgi:hypothetical protein
MYNIYIHIYVCIYVYVCMHIYVDKVWFMRDF